MIGDEVGEGTDCESQDMASHFSHTVVGASTCYTQKKSTHKNHAMSTNKKLESWGSPTHGSKPSYLAPERALRMCAVSSVNNRALRVVATKKSYRSCRGKCFPDRQGETDYRRGLLSGERLAPDQQQYPIMCLDEVARLKKTKHTVKIGAQWARTEGSPAESPQFADNILSPTSSSTVAVLPSLGKGASSCGSCPPPLIVARAVISRRFCSQKCCH